MIHHIYISNNDSDNVAVHNSNNFHSFECELKALAVLQTILNQTNAQKKVHLSKKL